MKYLFFLGHPAHFHLFKHSIKRLIEKKHTVFIIIKKKDILEDVLKESGFEYYNVLPAGRSDGALGIGIGVLKKNWELLKFCLKHRPDLMLGSVAEITHVGTVLHIPSIYTGEDDYHIAKQFAWITYPFASAMLSPVGCDQGPFNRKVIFYDGYQKLAYLHPNVFTPNREIVNKYIPTDKPYYLLRFAKLKAHHDIGIEGMSLELTMQIVKFLSEKGNVYISSERELAPELEKHRLKIDLLDIHHVMYYSDIYMGDSQSMAVEAAVLGVPSFRIRHDSKGTTGILEELENVYKLTFTFHPADTDTKPLFSKLKEIMEMKNLKEVFQARRMEMVKNKIDVTAFLVWFIENYPKSKKIMKQNPDYQLKFR